MLLRWLRDLHGRIINFLHSILRRTPTNPEIVCISTLKQRIHYKLTFELQQDTQATHLIGEDEGVNTARQETIPPIYADTDQTLTGGLGEGSGHVIGRPIDTRRLIYPPNQSAAPANDDSVLKALEQLKHGQSASSVAAAVARTSNIVANELAVKPVSESISSIPANP